MAVLNWDEIKQAGVESDPYPHFIVDQAIQPEIIADISNSFPPMSFAGLVPLRHVRNEGAFQQLMFDLQSDCLKKIIGEKLEVDLMGMPPLLTVRGFARQRDGRIHVDTFDKKVSILLYLNDEWQHDAGRLRVLRGADDLDDFVTEIPPLIGRMFVFKVTDNCWHGHKPLQAERRAVMLNYMADQSSYRKHVKKHSRSAFWKKVKVRLNGLYR